MTACYKINQRASSLHLNWIPGHSKIESNLKADKIAKEVSLKPPDKLSTTCAKLQISDKEKMIQTWTKYIDKKKTEMKFKGIESQYIKRYSVLKPNMSIQLPRNITRQIASAFYQLKLGHGYNRGYLYRLGHISNDKCEFGKKETPEHLLLSCTEYTSDRLKLKDNLNNNRLNLRLLMHTQSGIRNTLESIKSTQISTRGWYLSRKKT